ncbi:ROK family protein [Fusibacter sp. 3D3]|uniref:ROK family protein n=1 Tax=Fusibacter sp. 3D3 TaxID=1048380 RepID=UPI000852EE97|nr:ROK family protein [Fusibacter sp. 3D3]GAU77297.1 N-acetylmannosamine kinase [Fusibacter sp. 3D3]
MNYLAIDIGGTNIKYGLVSSSGVLGFNSREKTNKTSLENLVNQLSAIIDSFIAQSITFEGIALSVPAPVNAETGEILGKGSMDFLFRKNLNQILRKSYHMKITSENDGNCAALAEVWLGAAKNCQDVALVVCGTGIGGAIVKDRKIHTGKHLFAGEFGYSILDAGDRKHLKNWSSVASTKAMIDQYSQLKSLTGISGEEVFERAEQGDEDAKQVIDDFFLYNAIGIHNIQFYYDPELILLGGAISERADFLERLEEKFEEIYSGFDYSGVQPRVERCKFSNNANLLGAVYHHVNSGH